MGKTKDLGHLAHIVAYDSGNHITVPAGITMHTNQLVASQAWVTTALGSYALSSSLSSYVPTSRTITINGTTFDLSANRTFTIAAGLSSFNTRTGDVTLSSSDVTTALGYTPVTNARTITINGTAFDLTADRSWTISAGTTLNGTGFVKASGTTITYDNSTYLTGITSALVTGALGFTPYNATNPSGYITGITSANVTTALGFTPYNATNPSGYITSSALTPYLLKSGGTMTGTLTFSSISGAAQTVPNTYGAYLHLGDWAVARTAAGAVLVNTAYRADYATDLFDMNISRFTNNSGYITSSGKADGSLKFWATTHPNDYYLVNNWTGAHWYITSNHPSPVRVGYADNSGTTSQTNFSDLSITGAAHKYLTINPGNGYEAMVRYIGGSGSGWYVGKRTSGQLVGTQSFHFYSEEAGATVGGIDPGGVMFSVGAMRAPIFYDHNDTGYYLDPNGDSSLYRFTAATMTRNAINYLSINSPFTTRAAQGTPYQNGTIGWGNVDFNTVFSNWGSGFIDTWSSPGNAPGGSSHYVGLQGCHYNHQNSTNVYGFQMACAGEADNRFFWRSAWPSLRGWVEMVHSGNILSFSTSGNSANTIVRRDGSGDIAIGTLNTNHAYFGGGGRGLTSADSYGSYGNVHTYGTGQNGYSGYGAYDNAGYRSFFMWNSGNGGIYMQDRGKWELYYFGGNDCTGITGSETYDWVRACTNGKHRITNDSWCDATSWAYTFSNISDGRLKENIITVDSALDKVLQLRGVYYNWIIDTENKKHIGLIAQETAAVCPEVVNYHDETDTYSVNYSELSGLFVESTKELNQKLMDANARIELLETKLNQLLNA